MDLKFDQLEQVQRQRISEAINNKPKRDVFGTAEVAKPVKVAQYELGKHNKAVAKQKSMQP